MPWCRVELSEHSNILHRIVHRGMNTTVIWCQAAGSKCDTGWCRLFGINSTEETATRHKSNMCVVYFYLEEQVELILTLMFATS